jgi:DNA repair exonuclease SbcCD ATPase subunit
MIEELQKLEMKVSQALEEIINLREEKRTLLARIRELEETREDQKLLLDKIKDLEKRGKQFAAQEKQLKELAEERDEFRQKAVQLQNRLNELIESRREYEQWEERREEVQKRLVALIERISTIEAEGAGNSLEAIFQGRVESQEETVEGIPPPSVLSSEESPVSVADEGAALTGENGGEGNAQEQTPAKKEAEGKAKTEKEAPESDGEGSAENNNPTLEFPSEYFRSSDS